MTDMKVGDLRIHALHLDSIISSVLVKLASGQYDEEMALTEKLMLEMATAFPPMAAAEEALSVFLWINKMTASRSPVVPDGHGGYVPESNSRYDPATGEFL